MPPLRIVFMGTPDFAVPALSAVHDKHEIVAVYTQPDKPVGRGLDLKSSPVKLRALALGLPVYQPEKLSQSGEFEKLQALKPDLILVVAYGQILRTNVLQLPRLGCVNIHSSLLPRWRGAAPIQRAMLAGDAVTGITTMRLVEKLDAGDILLQQTTPISDEDTASAVHDRLAVIGAELVLPTLEGLSSGSITGTKQDESKVSYAAKLTKEMEALNPADSAVQLSRQVRALNPWPGTSLDVGQRLKVKQVGVRSNLKGHEGQIYEKAGMLLLGTSDGALELIRLQWDGKKEVDAGGFLNGLRGRGQVLPLSVKLVGAE
jgi:methionyl-tRNA formyltransferase